MTSLLFIKLDRSSVAQRRIAAARHSVPLVVHVSMRLCSQGREETKPINQSLMPRHIHTLPSPFHIQPNHGSAGDSL